MSLQKWSPSSDQGRFLFLRERGKEEGEKNKRGGETGKHKTAEIYPLLFLLFIVCLLFKLTYGESESLVQKAHLESIGPLSQACFPQGIWGGGCRHA